MSEPTVKYMVGVPAPTVPPAATLNPFTLKDVSNIQFVLVDETTDGAWENLVEINSPTITTSDTCQSYTFSARSSSDTSSTVTTNVSVYLYGGISTSEGLNVPLYIGIPLANMPPAAFALPPETAATVILQAYGYTAGRWIYYAPPAGTQAPVSLTAESSTTEPETGTVTTVTLSYNLISGTYWYSPDAGAVAPTNAGAGTTTTSTSRYKGPAAIVNFVMTDGSVQQGVVYPDSSRTTLPDSLAQDYNGTLTELTTGTPPNSNYVMTFCYKSASDNIEARAYVYTYVNGYGEEGPPSPVVEIDVLSGRPVTLDFAAPPTGYVPIGLVRFYRTATGTTTDYMFVGETNVANGLFLDDYETSSLGETLSTRNYYPPAQDLKGICMMANGIMAGFRLNEVHFSEPYLAYAWNPNAIKPFPYTVVSICPFEGGLYVTTTGNPFIVTGSAPEYMTDAKVQSAQAGISKGSIVNIGGVVVFASRDGLVMARGMDASLDLSFKLWTRDEWEAEYKDHFQYMNLEYHDGSLLVWFDNGTPGFLLRLEEEAMSFTRLSLKIHAAYHYLTNDTLLIVLEDSVGAHYLREFMVSENDRKIPFTWHSKDFILPRPVNMGVFQLVGIGSANVEIHADGQAVYASPQLTPIPLTQTDRGVYRLPSGFMARRWSIKVTGVSDDAELMEAYVAQSIGELKGV